MSSLVAHWKRIHLSMQETWVQPLGWKDPLENEMATHSRILAWGISWMEEPGMLQSMGLHRVGPNLMTKQQQWHIISYYIISYPVTLYNRT